MNLTDTIDTLNKQHEQIKSIIYSLNANEHFADISKVIVTGNLWAAGDLIEQAQKTTDDLYELINQLGDSKPEATVMMDGEPILNLEKELIGVLRDVVERIDLAERRGSYLLDHIDESRPKHDKANAPAPGGES